MGEADEQLRVLPQDARAELTIMSVETAEITRFTHSSWIVLDYLRHPKINIDKLIEMAQTYKDVEK